MSKTLAVIAITADRTAGLTVGLDQLPQAIGLLRGRLLALAEGLGREQWAGPVAAIGGPPTRSSDMSATHAACT